MKDIMKTGFILFLIAAIAAFALAFTNELTKDTIADQRQKADELAKMAVLPAALTFEEITDDELSTIMANYDPVQEVYIGYDESGSLVGYVFKSTPTGFGGDIVVITGIDTTSTVTGVRIGSHNETPGLGAKAKDAAFYEQYSGLTADESIGVAKTGKSGNEIQAITGATISSKAVTDGVNASIDAFRELNK